MHWLIVLIRPHELDGVHSSCVERALPPHLLRSPSEYRKRKLEMNTLNKPLSMRGKLPSLLLRQFALLCLCRLPLLHHPFPLD
jgi:hypothetical protein